MKQRTACEQFRFFARCERGGGEEARYAQGGEEA
jgi:hypothetical protein